MTASKSLRIAFVSSNQDWGGSELLWISAAAKLAGDGHEVIAYKNVFDCTQASVAQLRSAGAKLVELARNPIFRAKLYPMMAILGRPLTFGYQAVRLYLSLLLRRRPDLVVVCQGGNHDGWLFASVCLRLGLPYVLINQKASDLYWPRDQWRKRVQAAFDGALHSFFVSQHNLRLTQEQLGAQLHRASVVRNPFEVAWDKPQAWPSIDHGFNFACVGRLYPMEKGQDILIRVLARAKWRDRPVSLTFVGSGEQRTALEEMVRFYGLSNISFAGFSRDVPSVWSSHHALLLASRAEGLPLVIVEAMLSGRVPIVTNVAGNRELIEDDVTGFVAAAASEDAVDEAMERAWQARFDWQMIGVRAAAQARSAVPADPARILANLLIELCSQSPTITGVSSAARPATASLSVVENATHG
jgi:glycosyltransferase involved in cell wall biosynthesis